MSDSDYPAATSAHLLGADDIHALARKAGIRPTKKLGQNFMIDPSTVRSIVRKAGVRPGDRVIEVGPGLGSLTLALLEAGALVTAVEIDPRLAALLPQTVEQYQPENASHLRVIVSDALKLDASLLKNVSCETLTSSSTVSVPLPQSSVQAASQFADQSKSDQTQPSRLDPSESDPTDQNVSRETIVSRETFRLVSNLPYNVATPILLTLLERFPGLRTATVLVQDEVADRLTAGPGSKIYGVPSVKLAWFGDSHKAGSVARSVFWPVPNVDSSLVSFTRTRDALQRPQQLRQTTFNLIDQAFSQRRKTVRAALKKTATADQIIAAGIDPTARGERLTIDDYLRLARVLTSGAETD